MSNQYPETPIPVRAPGTEEDTDDVERQVSQRVDEGVDALDQEDDALDQEDEALDDALYDRGQGVRDRGDDQGRDVDDAIDAGDDR